MSLKGAGAWGVEVQQEVCDFHFTSTLRKCYNILTGFSDELSTKRHESSLAKTDEKNINAATSDPKVDNNHTAITAISNPKPPSFILNTNIN